MRAHLVLGALCLLWSGAFAAIKVLVDGGMEPRDMVVVRHAIVLPAFAVLLWRSGWPRQAGPHGTRRIVVGGVLAVAVYALGVAASEQTAASGTTSLIVAVAPAFALAIALAVGQESLSLPRTAGIGLAVAGVGAVIYGTGQQFGAADVAGPAFAVVAALAWAAASVVTKPALRPGNVVAATALANLAGILALAPLARPSAFAELTSLGVGGWFALLYLSVGCSFAGYLLWTEGLRLVPGSVANAYLLAVPPLSVVIGAVVLGEAVTTWVIAGAALIVTGIALAR